MKKFKVVMVSGEYQIMDIKNNTYSFTTVKGLFEFLLNENILTMKGHTGNALEKKSEKLHT
jgi:hypothetical protein